MAAGSRQSVRPAMDISATETQQSTSWEQFLMPGPSIIASLGDLVSISAYQKEDFSINTIPQEGGCHYLRYPDSFRTSVMQVCNRGWNVFNTAHTNMDQVRLLSRTIPQKIKTVVQTLSQDAKVVKVLLPRHLKSMRSAAEECTQLAQTARREFSDVIPTIQELYEACQRAKCGYEEEKDRIQMALESQTTSMQTAKKEIELAEKDKQEKQQQLDEAIKQCEEAPDNSCVRGSTSNVQPSAAKTLAVPESNSRLVCMQSNTKNVCSEVRQCISTKSKKMEVGSPTDSCPAEVGSVSADSSVKSPGRTTIPNNKREGTDSGRCSKDQYEQGANRDSIDKRRGPQPGPSLKHGKNTHGRRDAEQRRASRKEELERSNEKVTALSRQLCEIQRTLETREREWSDCDAVVKVLSNALDALGRVMEDWKTMGCFFQKICEMIDTCANKFMREFNDKPQSVQKDEACSPEVLHIDCINRLGSEASNIAQLVHIASELYTELSSQHLMGHVSSLGRLLTMDPTDPAFAGLSEKVGQGWKEAREAMSARVTERRKELDMTEL